MNKLSSVNDCETQKIQEDIWKQIENIGKLCQSNRNSRKTDLQLPTNIKGVAIDLTEITEEQTQSIDHTVVLEDK